MAITEAQLLPYFRKTLEIYETFRHAAEDASPGNSFSNKSLNQLTTDMEGLLKGTHIAQNETRVLQARKDMVQFLSGAANAIQDHIAEYIYVLNLSVADFADAWSQIFRNYMENAKRVLSRGFVFGTPAAAGANKGNGSVSRLNFDAWGQQIENQTPDAKTVRCTDDSVSKTALAEELFELRGAVAGRDGLEELGSGKQKQDPLRAISSRNSQQYGILNPSFSTATPAPPTTAPTDLGGWTSTVSLGGAALAINGTNYNVNTDTPYRGYEGDTTPAYVKCFATAWCLSQNLYTNGGKFDTAKAYFFQIAVRRQSTADGSLVFTVGGVSTTVALSSLTNNVWSTIQIGPSQSNWYKNFGQPNLTLSIARTGGTTGNVDVDDVCIGEYQIFDGGYYAVVGGPTAFSIEDKFTFTDTEYAGSVNQKWFWRVLGLYWPSCPAPPSTGCAAADGGAGVLSAGVYKWLITFVDVNGVESGGNATLSGGLYTTNPTQLTLAASHQANLTTIPTSALGSLIAKRKIYRTLHDGAIWYLVTTLGDNVATTYTDNNSDASISGNAQIPAGVTFTDAP